jgi:vitamin B12 transporter
MKRLGISLISLIAAAPLAAQDFVLDDIVISASLTEILAGRTGVTVDVLDFEALAPVIGTDLNAALDAMPGVSVASNGGFGTVGYVRLRGLSQNYTAVRLDGIDIADPSGPQVAFNFGGFARQGIGRAEVLRGAQSALYGSEAVGGVVSLQGFRVNRDGVSGRAEIEAGSFGTVSASLGAGIRGARGELSFGLTRLVTSGISAAASGTEKDSHRQTFATFYGAWNATETLTLGLNGFWRDGTTEYDGDTDFDGLPDDTADFTDDAMRGLRAFAELETGALRHEFSLARFETRRRTPLGFSTYFDGERTETGYLLTWDGGETLGASFGLDWTEESFATGGELRWTPREDLDLSLALRRDEPEDFPGKTTGRLALTWRLDEATILRASAGTGFRAPSLYEQFSEYGRRDPGEAPLSPEQSRSVEIGLERSFAEGTDLRVTLFESRIEDKIAFDGTSTVCASPFGCYVQTDGVTRARGVEVSGNLALTDRIALSGNYTYTHAREVSAAGVQIFWCYPVR